MSYATRSTLISGALLQAGAPDDLTSNAVAWLNDWLRSQYRGWPWPFLHHRSLSVALAKVAASVIVGAGSSGISPEIQQIFDPIWIYTSDYKFRGKVRAQNVVNGSLDDDVGINDPSTNVGTPTKAKIVPSLWAGTASTWGKWDIILNKYADKDYLLGIDYLIQPANLATDSEVPVYPNDRTIKQAICVEAWKHMGDERYGEGLNILGQMTVEDRMKYGQSPGTNALVRLDPSVFR